MKHLLLLLTSSYLVSCLPPHPAVVQVRQEEESLPPYLRSPALHNPLLRKILPLSSLLHEGEKLVQHREADDVSRREIYNILTHAGLIPRRIFQQQPPRYASFAQFHSNQVQSHDHFYEPPILSSPELLQHL